MRQEIVHLIGENDLLKLHALFAQRFHQLHHVSEGHVAVIVALNQQHG